MFRLIRLFTKVFSDMTRNNRPDIRMAWDDPNTTFSFWLLVITNILKWYKNVISVWHVAGSLPHLWASANMWYSVTASVTLDSISVFWHSILSLIWTITCTTDWFYPCASEAQAQWSSAVRMRSEASNIILLVCPAVETLRSLRMLLLALPGICYRSQLEILIKITAGAYFSWRDEWKAKRRLSVVLELSLPWVFSIFSIKAWFFCTFLPLHLLDKKFPDFMDSISQA